MCYNYFMIKTIEISLEPGINLEKYIKNKYTNTKDFKIELRSLDARNKPIYRYRITLFSGKDKKNKYCYPKFKKGEKKLTNRPIIIGAGPAGLFAGLVLSMNNYSPLIIEKGKCVNNRIKDIEETKKTKIINENSNICFGEGGAGTFSDGKVYTRSKDPFVKFVANILFQCGASENILYDRYPHIGTDVLRKILPILRKKILDNGGEFLFETELVNINIKNDHIRNIEINGNSSNELSGPIILACGQHNDNFYNMLNKNKIKMEYKDFAAGFRLEMPQETVNKSIYKNYNKSLPKGEFRYAYTFKDSGIGIYTFCMCPGGEIVNASVSNNRLILNGMSNSKRNGYFANSGFVITIKKLGINKLEEWNKGLLFRENIEKKAYKLTNSMKVPAQTIGSFIGKKGKVTKTSYSFGYLETDLTDLYPKFILDTIKNSMFFWNRKFRNFENAVLLAPETRTSSPVRILRKDMMCENIEDLYVCGEGSGYSGGIISSAVDGIKAAEMLMKKFIFKA